MRRFANGFGFLLLLIGRISAQQSTLRHLPIEDIVKHRQFGQLAAPQFSPDGKLLVYEATATPGDGRDTASRANVGIPTYAKGLELYLVDTSTGESRDITKGMGDNWSPAWSPDGCYLSFLSDRDGAGKPRLWLWEKHARRLREVSAINVRSNGIQWLPHSNEVVVATYPQRLGSGGSAKLLSKSSSASMRQSRVPGSTSVEYGANFSDLKSPSPREADPWSLNAYLCDLAVIDVANGHLRWVLKRQRIGEYAVSPDGSSIAYSTPVRFETAGSQQILWDLRLVSLATAEQRTLASDVHLEYDGAPFTWSPDSTRLAFSAGGPKERTGPGDCFVVDAEGGRARNLTSFPKLGTNYKQLPPLWDTQGKYVYLIHLGTIWKAAADGSQTRKLATIDDHRVVELAAKGLNLLWSPDKGETAIALTLNKLTKQSGFYQIDVVTAQANKLFEDNECFTCINADSYLYAAARRNEIAYFAEDAGHDSDLWISDATFRHRRRVSHLNPQLDKFAMGTSRLISWLNSDGEPLQGALLLPPGYEKTRRYPLIVWAYGGENGSDFVDSFGFSATGSNLQLLATRGYAVLFPDAPQHAKTPMMDLAKDVLPGVNKTIEMGIADPKRLGIVGQSYGGYCAVALIAQTKRFKAAVDIDGPANLVGMYGEMGQDGSSFGISLLEQGQGLMEGTPWQFRDSYIENSPFFYLDRVETPLLLVEGEKDATVAPFLTDEIFVALRRLGNQVEYVKYKGEGHSPLYWSFENQIDLWARIISWFDQHLGRARRHDSVNLDR